jgi:hypothetical protein
MKPDEESDSVERLVEVFQGDEWSGGVSSAADIIDMYQVTCRARECAALPLNEAAVQAVRAAIADVTKRWTKSCGNKVLETNLCVRITHRCATAGRTHSQSGRDR